MKEKMEQIFLEVADMTLERIKQCKDAEHTLLGSDELEMVRTTQSLYETINHANPVLATATMLDEFTPTDSSGTKYSALSSSTVRPTANREYYQ